MNTNTNTQTPVTPAADLPAPAAWIGLDWGHRTHAFALQDAAGHTQEGSVEHSPEALHAWLAQLATRFGGRPVRLAIDTDLAVQFLGRWPDLLSLKSARPATIQSFYYAHHVRRPETIQARVDVMANARALSTDVAQLNVAVRQLRLLLDQLKAFRKHVALFDEEIRRVFAAHPEAGLFRDLPGAGAQLAPRLCAAFGTIRTLYPEPAALQKHSGVAPVREKSGDRLWTHWRWLAPRFLRQTFVEWAGQTVMYSAWAKTYYQRMEAKGKSRQVILRALAFKWIRVLWKCWQERMPYDETRYLKQLTHRKSPYAPPAAQKIS